MKNEVTEYAHAKINLGLDIVGKRSDGYHLLRMVMQTLELKDRVTVSEMQEGYGIKTVTDSDKVSDDKDNLAYRAAALLRKKYGIAQGMEIKIEKHIPVAAGLAGGSSDAAAVMRAVNRLFELGLSNEDLKRCGVELGADVPYCIEGGTRLSEGIGELLTPVNSALNDIPVLLIKPDKGISTKEAYTDYDKGECGKHPDIDAVVSALEGGSMETLAESLGNVLESVSIGKVPEIRDVKEFLVSKGAKGVLMSGSGPTVFALDTDADSLKKMYEEGKKRFPDFEVILTKTCEP